MPKSRELRLAQAINSLSEYYGQFTNRDLSRFLATRRPGGVSRDTSVSAVSFPTFTRENFLLGDLINLIIDVSDGAYLLKDIVAQIGERLEINNEAPSAEAQSLRAKYVDYMTILSDVTGGPKLPIDDSFQKIRRTLFTSNGDSAAIAANSSQTEQSVGASTSPQQTTSALYLFGNSAGQINIQPNDPNKTKTNVGIILSHTPQLSIHNRFTAAASIFINGIPGLELSRAMPYLDVQIIAARPAIANDKLFAPSIYRFLLGAETAQQSSTLYELQTANSSSNVPNYNGNYTIMGMEAFLTPQTLATTNKNDIVKRSTEIFDQFKPLLSINDFSVEIVQSYAAYAYRTAKLSLILHDRGRMAEVAELFRPDLLFGTQFLIDYGWIHPDGEINDSENVYANIINGMRYKEKYRVTNWNFNLTDTGEVKVDLDLVTVGDTNIQTTVFVEDGINVGSSAETINRLVARIAELRRQIFDRNGQNSNESQREIRGYQFLDTVSDAYSNIRLTSEQRRQMSEFMTYLNQNNQIPNVSQLREQIVSLYGTAANGRVNGSNSVAGNIQTSVENQLNAKLGTLLKNEQDPFLVEEQYAEGVRPPSNGRVNQYAGTPGRAGGTVSLGNIVANFMALPLANSGQYDEIQLIFYPFNSCAGFASRLNIASFRVDIEFFKRKYTDYILNNLSRSGRMTIQQFWQFLITNILDDHGARSYGLFDQQGGLWRDPRTRNNNNDDQETTESEHYDAPTMSAKLACILRNVTPDGVFRMPQISYYLETVPAKPRTSGDNPEIYSEKTILRMHVYDEATDTRGGISQMMMADRNNALNIIPTPPSGQTTEQNPASRNTREYYTQIIQRARQANLVEGIEESGTPVADRIRWKGGFRNIKKFLYDVMPSIIYGANGSTIKSATVTSLQDQAATSINIVNAPGRNGEAVDPNGEESGALPLQVIPIEASITTYGCPLLSHGAQYFVDFGTGTSIDQIYQINGISHRISKTEFTSTVKLVAVDGYGTYRNYVNQLRDAARALNEIETRRTGGTPDSDTTEASRTLSEIDSQQCNNIMRRGRPRTEENTTGGGASGGGGGGGGGSGGGSRGENAGAGRGRAGRLAPRGTIAYNWRDYHMNTVSSAPEYAELNANQIGTINMPDGDTYQLTRQDLEMLARSLEGEGSDSELIIWSYVQNFALKRRARRTQGEEGPASFGSFIQAYSQPISPAWRRTGINCRQTQPGVFTEDARNRARDKIRRRRNRPEENSPAEATAITQYLAQHCSEDQLNHREQMANLNWQQVDVGLRRLVIEFAQGQRRIDPRFRGITDFAMGNVINFSSWRDDRIIQAGNIFFVSDRRSQFLEQGDPVSITFSGSPRFSNIRQGTPGRNPPTLVEQVLTPGYSPSSSADITARAAGITPIFGRGASTTTTLTPEQQALQAQIQAAARRQRD